MLTVSNFAFQLHFNGNLNNVQIGSVWYFNLIKSMFLVIHRYIFLLKNIFPLKLVICSCIICKLFGYFYLGFRLSSYIFSLLCFKSTLNYDYMLFIDMKILRIHISYSITLNLIR